MRMLFHPATRLMRRLRYAHKFTLLRRIRAQAQWRGLPIIALSAKAMPGDQKLCLDAGANDYISKPVDLDKLFSLMRVWLCQVNILSSGLHRHRPGRSAGTR